METTQYSIKNIKFWKAFGVHMRPYLLFVSGVAGLAGMAIASDFQPWRPVSLAAFLAFFLSYGFGQALTDCFQVDTDKLSAPYRPLSQGIVRPRSVGTVAMIGLVLLSSVLIILNYWNAVLCLLSVLGLSTYTFFKRKFWFAGPFYNAWIVALLPVIGYLIISGENLFQLTAPHLLEMVLLTFFSYSLFVLIGYLKDIEADRQAGYQTFPVVFGWDASIWVGDVLVIISTYLMWRLCSGTLPALIFGTAGTIMVVWGQLFAHFTRKKVESNAALPVTMTVRAFILWHLAVSIAFSPGLWLFGIVYLLVFELILHVRPMRQQV